MKVRMQSTEPHRRLARNKPHIEGSIADPKHTCSPLRCAGRSQVALLRSRPKPCWAPPGSAARRPPVGAGALPAVLSGSPAGEAMHCVPVPPSGSASLSRPPCTSLTRSVSGRSGLKRSHWAGAAILWPPPSITQRPLPAPCPAPPGWAEGWSRALRGGHGAGRWGV